MAIEAIVLEDIPRSPEATVCKGTAQGQRPMVRSNCSCKGSWGKAGEVEEIQKDMGSQKVRKGTIGKSKPGL